MLKDAAIAWVRANCIDAKLRSEFCRTLKDVMQRRIDCWFAVGQALTRQRVPYLIHCFARELFIFQLSNAQAAGLMLAPNALASSPDPRPAQPGETALPMAISLSKFALDKPILTALDRISGAFEYEISGEPPAACCLRLDCLLGLAGHETVWNSPEQVIGRSGQLQFSFDPLKESVWPMVLLHRGPAAVFIRVCTLPASGDVALRRAISNACGVLVDVG